MNFNFSKYSLILNKFGTHWMQRMISYCKFGNFHGGFIFREISHMRSFVKVKSLQNGETIRSFTDLGKSCPSREFSTSQICLSTLFAKIKSSQKFRIYSNHIDSLYAGEFCTFFYLSAAILFLVGFCCLFFHLYYNLYIDFKCTINALKFWTLFFLLNL